MGRRGELDCEPPDPAWMEEEARRRREAWDDERPQRRLAKRAERERMSLSGRVRALETELALSASMSAVRISGGGGGGKPDSSIPPEAVQSFSGEHPRELRRLWRLLSDVIVRIEALADRDLQAPLVGSDLDRVLFNDFEGYSPEDAASLEPLFGSPEAVRRTRRNAGRRGNDGSLVKVRAPAGKL